MSRTLESDPAMPNQRRVSSPSAAVTLSADVLTRSRAGCLLITHVPYRR